MNNLKITDSIKSHIAILAALLCVPAQATATFLPGSNLPNYTVVADTYVSTGDSAIVYGNVLAGTYGTSGAGSSIYGNFQSGTVATIGSNALVQGNLQSILAGTLGAGATVTGSFQAGAVGTTGAGAIVNGNFVSGLAGTTGAHSRIDGNFDVGGVRTLGAMSTIGGNSGATNTADMTAMIHAMESSLGTTKGQFNALKEAISAMGSGTGLDPTMTSSTTLDAGVYSAASLSTTAGTTLYLDGHNLANQTWLFNITSILATGANTNIQLIHAGANAQVFWNTGGYVNLGAGSTFLGTILATDYISVGAHAYLKLLDDASCSSLFSLTSYVEIGAGAQVGSNGCSAPTNVVASPVPVPQTYALMLLGLGAIGLLSARRRPT